MVVIESKIAITVAAAIVGRTSAGSYQVVELTTELRSTAPQAQIARFTSLIRK